MATPWYGGYGTRELTGMVIPPRRQPRGSDTRATQKTTRKAVKAVTKDSDEMIEGPVTRLFGAGTGIGGFVLENIKSATASNLSGTQVDLSVVDQNGNTYYWTVYPTKA